MQLLLPGPAHLYMLRQAVPPIQPQAPTQDIRTSPPPPVYRKYWDNAIVQFMKEAGLTQALRGFESDMVILNPEWERTNIPVALDNLVTALTKLKSEKTEQDGPTENMVKTPLDERKLQYVDFADGVEPRTPSTVTKSISRFLAQNRARNDASNRQEFLLSLAEKRRRLSENGDYEGVVASCARIDAKTQNRDLQMKFDVAKNEDGPLRKTLTVKPENTENEKKAKEFTDANSSQGAVDDVTAERHPGLDDRLRNIETHLAVRYVPSPPRSLLDRLKFIEDHLVHLETEYPPWAALHFNQPRRGWPPPPRPTPIIVPSHLTSAVSNPVTSTPLVDHAFVPSSSTEATAGNPGMSSKAKGKQAVRSTQSSLHRAVMERLEVQKAMNDLAGK
ncbi:hypothetical protein BDW22DRAFT_556449 [Trametopsis cervina]|nr:hypothetical protein BDW22DRAFT_556449 [Trametopsis cervina]